MCRAPLDDYIAGRLVAEASVIGIVGCCHPAQMLDVARQAARRSHKHLVLRLLRRMRVVSVIAARMGCVATVRHIVRHGRDRCLDSDMCAAAARRGSVKVMRCLISAGVRWDAQSVWGAARGGHHGMLKWLLRSHCPVDAFAVDAAVRSGSLEALRVLRAHGLYVGIGCHIQTARLGGSDHIADWLERSRNADDELGAAALLQMRNDPRREGASAGSEPHCRRATVQ